MLYAIERDQKIWLAYNEFTYIKITSLTVNWGIGSTNMVNLQSLIREFAGKKSSYNEVHPYMHFYSKRKNLESFFEISDTHYTAYCVDSE